MDAVRTPRGQWSDPVWENAAASASIHQNFYRWYEPGTGRYSRTDPLGLLRAGGLAQSYGYAYSSPLLFVDRLGLDAVTDNADIQDCFFCMVKASGFGTSLFEQAAWIVDGGRGLGCSLDGWQLDQKEARWPAGQALPDGLVGQAHTHPTRVPRGLGQRQSPEPSAGDRKAAGQFKAPVYTIAPGGIWKYDPSTGRTTMEAPSNWTKAPKKRCKKRCDEVLGQ